MCVGEKHNYTCLRYYYKYRIFIYLFLIFFFFLCKRLNHDKKYYDVKGGNRVRKGDRETERHREREENCKTTKNNVILYNVRNFVAMRRL